MVRGMKKVLKKLENFWYHYKWVTVIVAVFVVIITVCTVQMVTKEEPDASLIYMGPSVITNEGISEMQNIIAKRLDSDFNNDGKKIVLLSKTVIMTDEQIEEQKNAAAEEGETIYYDVSLRGSAFTQAKTYITSGEMLICIIDEYWYTMFKNQGLFLPLSDIFEEVPENAYDEYGVRLCDTDFGKYNSVFSELPENTMLCMVKQSELSAFKNQKEAEERYEYHLELFKSILSFEVE